MSRLDRYILANLLRLFCFFTFLLTAIFWINHAVGLFDQLIGDGQSALVFLEFTLLSLPRLIFSVLPVATFAATSYLTHRLLSDSELTVLLATGTSPMRIAYPVFLFGALVALLAAMLSNILIPLALAQLSIREDEIAKTLSTQLIAQGEFQSPTPGLTVYTSQIDANGVLSNIFLSDRRKAGDETLYTASQAYILRADDAVTLVLIDGMAQFFDETETQLSTAQFSQVNLDFVPPGTATDTARIKITELTSDEMLTRWAELSARSKSTLGAIAEELHGRIGRPLFCIAAALMGFAVLVSIGFSRLGVWHGVAISFVALMLLDGLRTTLGAIVLSSSQSWPLLYLPALLGIGLATALLWMRTRFGILRRRRVTA